MLTIGNQNDNFTHEWSMPNCTGYNCQKSSTRFFMFDDPIQCWSTIFNTTYQNEPCIGHKISRAKWLIDESFCLVTQAPPIMNLTHTHTSICVHDSLGLVTTNAYMGVGTGRCYICYWLFTIFFSVAEKEASIESHLIYSGTTTPFN